MRQRKQMVKMMNRVEAGEEAKSCLVSSVYKIIINVSFINQTLIGSYLNTLYFCWHKRLYIYPHTSFKWEFADLKKKLLVFITKEAIIPQQQMFKNPWTDMNFPISLLALKKDRAASVPYKTKKTYLKSEWKHEKVRWKFFLNFYLRSIENLWNA